MISMLESVLSRPKTVLTLMVFLVATGIASYIAIPKEANPDIDVPVFYVSIGQQGLSPEDGVRLIARPMETSLRGLDGLKEITSVSSEGHVGIVLEFDIDFDKDEALADVRDKVDEAQAEIPEEADEPTIHETNFSLEPTIYVTLSGQVPERTLYQHARRLKDEVESIQTVLSADLRGHREELLEVLIDQMKLESYDITQTELINAVTRNNQLVAAGFLDTGQGRFNVKVPGLFEDARDVFELPIKVQGDGVVTLGDVAEIRRTFKDPTVYTRVNGNPAITIEVVKRIGTNIIENNRDVHLIVDEFTKDWPQAIQVTYMIDQSNFIFEVLGSLQSAIMTAIALVMIVVVAALGMRSGLLVGIAIPTSFMLGFLILSVIGMTVNMMVMFGLVLTVGMLVDGAIVIVEYADRKMAEGLPRDQAYKRAARLMFWPIVSSTATTLAAFLPLLLWPGVPGEFMSYLPIMVIIVLSGSLVTAMVFLPTLGEASANFFDWFGRNVRWIAAGAGLLIGGFMAQTTLIPAAEAGALPMPLSLLPPFLLTLIGAVVGLAVLSAVVFGLRLIGQVLGIRSEIAHEEAPLDEDGKFDVKRVNGLAGAYVNILRWPVRSIWAGLVVVVAITTLTAGVFIAFAQNNRGVEFFIEEEPDQAIILISARGNLSAREMRDLVLEVEHEVLQVTGIENTLFISGTSSAGGGGTFGVQDTPPDMIGQINIELVDYCCRRKAVEIFADIRQRTADIAGIHVEIRKIEGGPPTGKDVRLQITSHDYDAVAATTARVRDFVDTSMADLREIEDTRPLPGIEWELIVDREEAGRFGTDVVTVGSMVQMVTNGVLVGKYRPDDSEDEVDIRVRLPEEDRSIDQLDLLNVRTPNGLVPLRNFVERTPKPKVSTITRRDGRYAMDVKANLVEGVEATPDDKVAELQAWLDTQTWPESIQFRFRGADEEQRESGEFLVRAMMASLFIMFIILVTQFNSFYQASLTLLTVVLSVVGVLVGMMVTGQRFSIIMTGTGVIALAGIVVNNAIVLMDTYNRFHRGDGMAMHDAILRTASQRLRPILLTTITTMLGLVPMALQINLNFFEQRIMVGGITSIWWVQLSTAIIFGLGFSTLLTLFLIPTLLALPGNFAERFGSVAGFIAQRREARLARIEARREANKAPPETAPNEPAVAAGRLAEAAE